MAVVLNSHGAVVERAVTCGDLPDLRSLTMPLIEELDLEVETLGSSEGLRPSSGAAQDRFAEAAPAIRLACAAAVAPMKESSVRMPAALPVAVLLIVAGIGAYVF